MDDSNHAVGLELEGGIEILIHIGVDTVELKGEGFESYIKNGDKVEAGAKLIHFDREALEAKGYCMEVMQIVMEGDKSDGNGCCSRRDCCGRMEIVCL